MYKEFENNFKSIFILLLFFTIYSCTSTETIETRSFPVKNNPEHIFNLNIYILKDTIVGFFNLENQIKTKKSILNDVFYDYYEDDRNDIYFSVETASKPVFSKDYFKKSNTTNDIYVHDFGDTWLSKLYFSEGKPLRYRTPFIIKLSKINDVSTRVSIVAEKPVVLNGVSRYSAHGAVARESTVDPTTIEEYTLLLFIAQQLGDTTLLPLKLPEMVNN